MVLQPDTPHVHLKVKHPTSYLETLVHLVKTCAGTGILALPNSFIKSGWLVGVIGTLATGFVCTYAIHLLVRSGEELWRRKQIESITYHTTWQGAIEEGPERLRWLAPYAPTMTRTFFFVGNMGVASISVLFISSNIKSYNDKNFFLRRILACISVLLISTNIKSIVDYYQDPLDQFHIRWYSLGLLVPLILINWVRNLKYLAPVSTFGTAAFSISIAIVFYYIFQDLPPLNTREPFGSWEGLPQFFTTAIYAVECIGMIMPLRKEMKHSEQFSSVFGVVNVGMVLYLIIFTSFGFFGYLKYGEKSAASVTINMPQGDILSQVSKLLMALSIVTTHALNIYIAFDIFWNDFIKPRLEKKILLVEYIFRTILVTVTVLVAMVVPYLDLAISLMGSLVLTSLGLAVPALMDLFTSWHHVHGFRFFIKFCTDGLIVLIGASALVIGVTSTLHEFVSPMYSDKRTKAEEEVALISDEDCEPEQRSWRTTAPQILVTMVQGMQILSFGMLIAVPTVVIGALYNSTGKLSMDRQQASWFAGLLLINQPVGSLLSGFLQESLGRKKCMLLVNVPELAAWVRLYTAQSMITIYMSAVLMGFCCGFLTPTLSYLGEVCQPHLRGRMVSLTGVFLASGHLLVYLLGAVKDWRTLSAVCSSVPILTTIFIFQIPESPVWLVINGKDEEAKTALAWLRGWVSTENIMMEFESLKDHIRSKHQNIVIHNDGNYYSSVPVSETEAPAVVVEKSQWGETISCLTRAEMLRPLRVTVLFFFFYCCAAITGSRAYLVVIFKMLHTNVDPFLGPVIAVICLIMGTVICILCIRKVGKRKLSLLSMTCCSLFTSIFGAYAYLHQTNGLMIPLFPEILYCCLYFFTNLGIGIIPWVLISEVFPPRGKGLGGGIAAASYYCFWFLTSKSFLFLESLISLSGVYFFYSGLGVCGIAFVYFYLPETESKTLAEVEEIFKTKKLDNSKKRLIHYKL